MSVLHSITRGRHAVAHGPAASCWPTGTEHTLDDIVIRGESLSSAAREGNTPLVRIGEAPARQTSDAGRQDFITVVVARVEHVDHLGLLQRPDVWVDAVLGGCAPITSVARIIGRRTDPHARRLRLLSEADPGGHIDVRLPADVRVGDLVAIPCTGTVPRHQVIRRPVPRHPLASEPADDPGDDAGWFGVCGK